MKTLVFLEQRHGQLKASSLEAIAAAKKINSNADDLAGVLIGDGVQGLAEQVKDYGIGQVFAVENAQLQDYQVLNYAAALQKVIDQFQAKAVVAIATPMGRDLLPRLAARYQSGILTDVTSLEASGDSLVGKKPIFAGKCTAHVALKPKSVHFVTVRPNTFKAEATGASGGFKVSTVEANLPTSRLTLKEVRKGQSQKADLTEASIIISGGRALGSADAFSILHECAEPIGATVGASRAAVDSGFAPHDMQVGQTGKTVNPNLYIACGISGSVQHMAGMRTSKVIVAINTDAEAPIFKVANYGIVGDLFEVVPALTKKFQALNS
ncbi:MAG: electron transfer flavoprotein subunit alpha/FixB family protein [Oligoflexus sp.]